MALSVYPRPEPATSDRGVCTALLVFAALALHDRPPPPNAKPETAAFVTQLNTDLALLRQQIKEACGG